jgi:hypothetical protein
MVDQERARLKRIMLKVDARRVLRREYRRERRIVSLPLLMLLSRVEQRDLLVRGELEHRLGLVWALRQKAALRQWLRAMSDRLWK